MASNPGIGDSPSRVRSRSPEAVGGNERKRRRKVLSCYDCRRRKLQCDRALPACGRCTKAGQAASCIYVDDLSDTPNRNTDSAAAHVTSYLTADAPATKPAPPAHSGDLLSRLEYQDRRIKELESALSAATQTHSSFARSVKLPLTPESLVDVATTNTNATDRETMLIRGKSFKTQFHGLSHPGSLLAYIPELSSFTKETFEMFPGLLRIRQELKGLQDRTEYGMPRARVTSDEDLKALMPPRSDADELLHLYLDSFDPIYHIVHTPTLLRQYEEMWTNMAAAPASFVALVLLMMACVQCLKSTTPWLYAANSSAGRDRAITLIRACEGWVVLQSQKQVAAVDFQIRFLINLARLVNGSKFKRTWTDAGTFVRFCMAAGLHRNPDLLRKATTAMDKELRRRIWFAAADFELECSFARGMMSTPWPQQSDYVPPTHLTDDDIDQEEVRLPPRRSLNEYTAISHLVVSNESFMLRYQLNAILNNIRHTVTFDEAKRFTDEIETHLSAIPAWTDPKSDLPRALNAIALRNYLLVLHDRQIRHNTSSAERQYSQMAILEAARKIIDDHQSLPENSRRVLLILRHDQMRSALSVCHVFATLNPQSESLLYNFAQEHATNIITETLALIQEKIDRLGCEQRQLWMVHAANAFMRTKKDPARKRGYMEEAVDKVMRQFHMILANQEDVPSTVSSGPPTGRLDMPEGIIEYLPSAGQKIAMNGAGANDPVLLDFDAIAAWTFDDWTFNPGDFPPFENTTY